MAPLILTYLSTNWKNNDYLSQKIDYRLIVDIIDSSGHPANTTNMTSNMVTANTICQIVETSGSLYAGDSFRNYNNII